MRITERPLAWFVDRIVAGEPTTFSRWGDGEWYSVFGRTAGHNCDGHDYFPRMGTDLKAVLLARPTYVLGVQGLARRLWPGKIEAWVDNAKLGKLDWIDADVFHNASRDGMLGPLVEALGKVDHVMAGPPHLARLDKFLGTAAFITVPPRNSYLAWERVVKDLCASVDGMPAGGVISISAGMPAKLIVHKLHARYGKRHSIIDFGSVWDPYAGVKSRRYHQGMDVAIKE